MENATKKCSFEEHKEIDAIIFCQDCNIYLWYDCNLFHSKLFKKHHQYKIDDNSNNIELFTGLCKEKNHLLDLKYYCKTHNELCCAKCITKIKDEENGKHSTCDINLVEDFKNNIKSRLDEDKKSLEKNLLNFEQSIKELNGLYEKIVTYKEGIKINIQKKFTKIRNSLNNAEDKLLKEIDDKYNYLSSFENKIKNEEKFSIKSKNLLDKIISLDLNFENNKINSIINDCINIENNIKELSYINNLNKIFQKRNQFFFKYEFIQNKDEDEILPNIINNFYIKEDSKQIFDSYINFDENLIKSWLGNKLFFAELLYRKTRDGSSSKDFHSRCDNKGATITIIETSSGYKFGGYTDLGWEGSGCKINESIFLFSFKDKQKYLVKNNSIYCSNDYGPIFGITLYNRFSIECKECKKKEEEYKKVCKKKDETIQHLLYERNRYHGGYVGNKSNKNKENIPTFMNENEIYFSNRLDEGISYSEKYEDLSKKSKEINNNDRELIYEENRWEVRELEVYQIIYI